MKIRIVPLSKRIWNAQLVFRKSANCNHTFTACKMGRVSVFSAKQTAWIIYKFGEVKSITSVRRSFGTTFFPKHPHDVPSHNAFVRLIERFEGSGGNATLKTSCNQRPTPVSDIQRINFFFKKTKTLIFEKRAGSWDFLWERSGTS